METVSADDIYGVESEIVDIGKVPLAARQRWCSAVLQAAKNVAVHRLDNSQVCDQARYNAWSN